MHSGERGPLHVACSCGAVYRQAGWMRRQRRPQKIGGREDGSRGGSKMQNVLVHSAALLETRRMVKRREGVKEANVGTNQQMAEKGTQTHHACADAGMGFGAWRRVASYELGWEPKWCAAARTKRSGGSSARTDT